jgi:hypothetical protein
MKINKAKLLVGTLAIASVAATVGSISGTVAWFQYNTRASVSYQGTTAHCSESLEIRIRTDNTTRDIWKTELTPADIGAYLTAEKGGTTYGAGRADANSVRPVTSGALAAGKVAYGKETEDSDPEYLLYKNPIYQHFAYTTWGKADINDFVLIPLELRVRDVDGASDAALAKKIYITDITLDGTTTEGKTDVTEALRLGVRSWQKDAGSETLTQTYSTNGEDVNVYGELDLNADGRLDGNDKYVWDDQAAAVYGTASAVAKSTIIGTGTIANDDSAYSIDDSDTVSALVGETTSTKTVCVDLLIYLEGWTELTNPANYVMGVYDNETALNAAIPVAQRKDGDLYKIGSDIKKWDASTSTLVAAPAKSALWDAKKTIGAAFNAGIRFSTEAHKNGAE